MHWLVRHSSKEITDHLDSQKPPTIDIAQHGPTANSLVAAFNFDFIEGTMLLALNQYELDVAAEEEDDKYPSGSENQYSEDDEEYIEKRKAQKTKRGHRLGGDMQSSRRILFHYRGRETGEGEIFSDPHKGYLNFTDETFTVFKGRANIEYIGDDVEFEASRSLRALKILPSPGVCFRKIAFYNW